LSQLETQGGRKGAAQHFVSRCGQKKKQDGGVKKTEIKDLKSRRGRAWGFMKAAGPAREIYANKQEKKHHGQIG